MPAGYGFGWLAPGFAGPGLPVDPRDPGNQNYIIYVLNNTQNILYDRIQVQKHREGTETEEELRQNSSDIS